MLPFAAFCAVGPAPDLKGKMHHVRCNISHAIHHRCLVAYVCLAHGMLFMVLHAARPQLRLSTNLTNALHSNLVV